MARLVEISDISSPELDIFSRLTEAQLRNRREPEMGVFIAESQKVIHVALDAGCAPVSLLMERQHIEGKGAEVIARCGDAPVYTGRRETLEKLTGYKLNRGILCAMRRPKSPGMEEVCADARRVAVLENVVDTTNIGAIFRSAAALGMDGVLLSPGCCDPLNRRAVRVSMGTVLQVPWAYVPQWPQAGMEKLQAMGFQTVALALGRDTVSIDDPRLAAQRRLAIVLGAEGDGLAESTIASCDYTARIPMAHGVDSLNVAAAGAVAFWQLRARPED